MLGIGLGQSRQPGALHLPNAQNDFVFAVVAQELGLIGGLAVIGFYLLFAYRGMRSRAALRPTRSAPCWRPASPPG